MLEIMCEKRKVVRYVTWVTVGKIGFKVPKFLTSIGRHRGHAAAELPARPIALGVARLGEIGNNRTQPNECMRWEQVGR